jgi:hypothetical protein
VQALLTFCFPLSSTLLLLCFSTRHCSFLDQRFSSPFLPFSLSLGCYTGAWSTVSWIASMIVFFFTNKAGALPITLREKKANTELAGL